VSRAGLRERLAALVADATDGEVSAVKALRADATLNVLGVSSLGFLRLVDAIEAEYAVELELDSEPGLLDSVDTLAAALSDRGVRVDAGH
jgi:acyl carrier protein